ncbi:MAG: CIA30 family protein [Chlamydiae bacterium]|nr:CIA30 family protein [Chlamydiota bacterium]MBI3266426.1 CIA30 family protein [Chlamydiota bacterium]
MKTYLAFLTSLVFISHVAWGELELEFNPNESSLKHPSLKSSETFESLHSSPPLRAQDPMHVRLVIDDFDMGSRLNHLGGSSGTWDKDPQNNDEECVEAIVYDPEHPETKNKVLRLHYDVDSPRGGYNGFWTSLSNLELKCFEEIRFRVKGDRQEGFTRSFKIELKNSSKIFSTYIYNIQDQWQEIVIPLKKFSCLPDSFQADELTIVFEDRVAKPRTGTLYFDDIALVGPQALFEEQKRLNRQETNEQVIEMLEMTNQELATFLQRKIFDYFLKEVDFPTGLIKDRSTSGSPISIAATGFGLVAYSLGEKHGWLSRPEAYQKILRILKTLNDNAAQEHGYFYHFLTPQRAKRWGNSEVSSMDTALLISGVLFAGEYFKGTEIESLAQKIYERVEWPWMSKNPQGLLFMEWTPERDFEGSAVWNMTAEEMMLYLLAMGSPTHPLPPSAWSQWKREWTQDQDLKFISDPNHSLFTQLYTQAFIDLRNQKEGDLNYWANAQKAVISNRNFCITHQNEHKGYGPWGWGLSASDGPQGYRAYGAQEKSQDGTLTPYAVIASLPLEPKIVLQTFRHMLYEQGEKIWGPYGPTSAYNVDKNWYSSEYVGIDEGIMILMIENFEDETVWKHMTAHPAIQRGMTRAKFHRDAARSM